MHSHHSPLESPVEWSGHASHESRPSQSLYVPDGHGWHVLLSSSPVPAGQTQPEPSSIKPDASSQPSTILQSSPDQPGKQSHDPSPMQRPLSLQVTSMVHSSSQPSACGSIAHAPMSTHWPRTRVKPAGQTQSSGSSLPGGATSA